MFMAQNCLLFLFTTQKNDLTVIQIIESLYKYECSWATSKLLMNVAT